MKKTILGLMLALTTHCALTADLSSKINISYTIPAKINAINSSKIPGLTFIGNHKFLTACAVTAAVYTSAEIYNWKKGKELHTVSAYNWVASSSAGIKTASAWTTFKSWFTAQSTQVQTKIEELKLDPSSITTGEIIALSQTVEDLVLALANARRDINSLELALKSQDEKMVKMFSDLKFDTIRTDIFDMQQKIVTKETLKQSQENSIELFATKDDVSKDIAGIKKSFLLLTNNFESITRVLEKLSTNVTQENVETDVSGIEN